jgi:hypothetical protein
MNDVGTYTSFFLIEKCFVCKESPGIREPAHVFKVRVTLVIQNSNSQDRRRYSSACLSTETNPIKWATFMQ